MAYKRVGSQATLGVGGAVLSRDIPAGNYVVVVVAARAGIMNDPRPSIISVSSGTQLGTTVNSGDCTLKIFGFQSSGGVYDYEAQLDQFDARCSLVLIEFEYNGSASLAQYFTASGNNSNTDMGTITNTGVNQLAVAVQIHQDATTFSSGVDPDPDWNLITSIGSTEHQTLVETIDKLNTAANPAFTIDGGTGGSDWIGCYFSLSDNPNVTVLLGTIGMTGSVPTATVSIPKTVLPDVVTGTGTPIAPTVSAGAGVTPAEIALTGTVLAPSIDQAVTVLPGVVSATSNVLAPSFVTQAVVSVGVVAGTLIALSPGDPIQLTSGTTTTVRFDNSVWGSIVYLPPASEFLAGGPILILINASSGSLAIKNFTRTTTVVTLAAGKAVMLFLKSTRTDDDWLARFQRTYNTARTPAFDRDTTPCEGEVEPIIPDLDPASGASASGTSGPSPGSTSLSVGSYFDVPSAAESEPSTPSSSGSSEETLWDCGDWMGLGYSVCGYESPAGNPFGISTSDDPCGGWYPGTYGSINIDGLTGGPFTVDIFHDIPCQFINYGFDPPYGDVHCDSEGAGYWWGTFGDQFGTWGVSAKTPRLPGQRCPPKDIFWEVYATGGTLPAGTPTFRIL